MGWGYKGVKRGREGWGGGRNKGEGKWEGEGEGGRDIGNRGDQVVEGMRGEE